MTMKKRKLSFEECKKKIDLFFEKQEKFKDIEKKFKKLKSDLNEELEDYFQNTDTKSGESFTNYEFETDKCIAKRVQATSIVFDVDKLEKALKKIDRQIANAVIVKKCEIYDVEGFIAYLKELGADPKIFKSFLTVQKSVDKDELNRLSELGKITVDKISGCYSVQKKNPYYTVKRKG